MSDALRIGDAEREQAAADLGEHFAQGRLSVDEHAERLEQVWVAKTRAELVPLFRDLPGGAYGARPAGPAPAPQGQWRGPPVAPAPVPGAGLRDHRPARADRRGDARAVPVLRRAGPLVRQPRPAAPRVPGPLLPLSQQFVDPGEGQLGQLAQRPGRVAGHQRLDPVGDLGRQVLAQVAEPEVVARRAVLGPDQPDQRRQREAQVEVGGLRDVAAGDRAVDQPLVGRPALSRLRRPRPPAPRGRPPPRGRPARPGRAGRPGCRAGACPGASAGPRGPRRAGR